MKKYVWSILIGLAVGALTLTGQKYLPVNLNFLANSGSVWLVPAFLFAGKEKEDRFQSVLLVILCLFGCVYGYYIHEAFANSHAFSFSGGALFWTAVSIPAGIVFGLGAYYASKEEGKLRYAGMNLLPAVFTAEGLNNLIHLSSYSHMIPAVFLKIIIGILLYILIDRKDSLHKANIGSYLLLSLCGAAGFELLYIIL